MNEPAVAGATGPPEEIVVGEFEKNARETVKVRLTAFQGHELVDIRAFYGDDRSKPGKGIALRRELLPELRKAIVVAEKMAKG